jgi:UDP-N-acetyl-D-glucosamine dehydrogenase
VDPGNVQFPLHRIPKVVGGASPASTEAACALYATIFEQVHPVSSPTTAELSKLLENTFRNVNIALVNEFAQICDTLKVDVWEVIEAARTKPFGFMPFYPGPGIGGHCIPLDPQYLVYKSRLHGYEPRLVALADQINQERPRYVVQQAIDRLNEMGKALRGAKVLVLGVAYKTDVPDLRESPALPILQMLLEKGACVTYFDPLVPQLTLENGVKLSVSIYDIESIKSSDLIIIITGHKQTNYSLLEGFSQKILDTRNIVKRSEN